MPMTFSHWKEKGTGSLKYAIVVPVVVLVLVCALTAGILIYGYLDRQLIADAKHRAEIIAYSVQYTAEIAGVSPELNRTVQALGTESDVKLINVIHLAQGQVIASNRFGWRSKTIDEVGLSLYHRLLLKKFIDLNVASRTLDDDFFELQAGENTYTYASPFLLYPGDGLSTMVRAIVIVDLDVSKAAAEIQNQMQLLAALLLIAVLGVTILIYLLLVRYVFRPINYISQAIRQRSTGNTSVNAVVIRGDEIGVLAQTLNDLIALEESSKQELLERERELKLIFDNVPVRIWYKDDKNTILRLNHYAAESMGMTVDEVEGKNTADLFPEMADKYLKDDLEVIHSSKPKLNIIEKYTPAHGSVGWVKTDKVPYDSVDGYSKSVLVVAQDITPLKQAEENLRESETRFQLAIEAARDGIWDWPNMEENYQYWSPQWKALLGYSEHDIEAGASTFFELLHPDDVAHVESAIINHIENNIAFDVECRFKTKAGEYQWFQTKAVVTTKVDDNVRRMTGSITDIQYRKEAERKLQEYNAELERSNRDLDEFAYVASHDLKSPLRGIAQIATWIAEDIEEGNISEVRPNLAIMQGRVKRMERLLNDLLEYSRVGRQEESLQELNVNTLARELFTLSAPPKDFVLEIRTNLPIFTTLAAPFEQVLRNLIGNAIKHHDRADGKIAVSCSVDNEKGFYEFCVQDDGPGIDEKYHELVFKMFKSLKSRDEVEGSGIGLALIQKIVLTYGGEIRLESSVGQGATFFFSWPMHMTVT